MARCADSTTLEAYIETHIWKPIDITTITFQLGLRPEMLARKASVSQRGGPADVDIAAVVDLSARLYSSAFTPNTAELNRDSAGAGAFAMIPDDAEILPNFASSNCKLLGEDMLDELTKPRLPTNAKASLKGALAVPEMNDILRGIGMGIEVNHALGGAVVTEDSQAKGLLAWLVCPTYTGGLTERMVSAVRSVRRCCRLEMGR